MSVQEQDMSLPSYKFIENIDPILNAKGWSDYRLSQKAGISHSVMSRARKGDPPKWDAASKIAQAINLPETVVFEWCDLLKPPPKSNPTKEEFLHLLDQMTPEEQTELLNFARFQFNQREMKDGAKSQGRTSEGMA